MMGAAEMEEALRQWRQAHPQASWDEIETAVQRHLAELQAGLMAELAGPADEPEDPPPCPACGEAMRACGRRTREVLTRMGRAVPLQRAYSVCPACGTGLFPPR